MYLIGEGKGPTTRSNKGRSVGVLEGGVGGGGRICFWRILVGVARKELMDYRTFRKALLKVALGLLSLSRFLPK